MHKHFCLNCEAVVAEGNFDCGHDTDHDDLEHCDNCVARASRGPRPICATFKQQGQIRPPH
jgi:hypothetical protein